MDAVKKDGETKPTNTIGEISLPTNADVFLDSTDSIEIQKATPKTAPSIPTTEVTSKIDPSLQKGRPIVIDDSRDAVGLPPFFAFITVRYLPEFRDVYDSSVSAFRRSWVEPPSQRVPFRVVQYMDDPEYGLGTYYDQSLFGMDFRPRDFNGNFTDMSNPSSWLGFPVFDPQPDPHPNDLVYYSSRYTQPWIDAGRSDLVDKALLALRHVTNQRFSFTLGGIQSDAAYLQNSCQKLYPDEFVPYYGGPPISLGIGNSSFAIADAAKRWEPNPDSVDCPGWILQNPGYDAATCYYWLDPVANSNIAFRTMGFGVTSHILYLADLEDENTWRHDFGTITNIFYKAGGATFAVPSCATHLSIKIGLNGHFRNAQGGPDRFDQEDFYGVCSLKLDMGNSFFYTFNYQ